MGVRPERTKSLQELAALDLGRVEKDDTPLIARCKQLLTKPLGKFTAEDLRVMIGQGLALGHLVPLAIDLLVENPLAEGAFFPGDLLAAVLRLDGHIWSSHPEWRDNVSRIVLQFREQILEEWADDADLAKLLESW